MERPPDKLMYYTMNSGGSDGCHVAFTANEYAYGEREAQLDGVIVCLVIVFDPKMRT